MREFIIKYEIWIFLVFCALVNIPFVEARASDLMSVTVFNYGRFCILLVMLICLLKYTRGNKGILNLFKPMLVWKVHPKWYLLSLVFTVTLAITTLLIKGLYNDVAYDSFIVFKARIPKAYLQLFIWAFLGEVVWVSYCIRELSKITKPFYAGLIVAVFWTLWFIPIILNNEGIFVELPILPFFFRMMGVAGILAFVYRYTKSGICVLILQTMSNFTTASFPVMPSSGGPTTYAAFATLSFLVMLGFWYFANLNEKRKMKVL